MFEQLLNDAYNKLAQMGSNAAEIANFIANFDGSIAAPVGKGGTNNPKDVLSVRMLLNGFIATDSRMKPLTGLDLGTPINPGNSMDPTITAIIIFQREIAKFNSPDGKVSPNQRTHTELKGFKWKAPPSKPKVQDPIPELGAAPVLLTDAQARSFTIGGSVSLGTYGWPAESIVSYGETWLAPDGERTIYQASHADVIFTLLKPRNGARPGAYIQLTKWFAQDVNRGAVGSEVARRCETIRKLMLIECEFFIGLGCALSLPASLFMMTMEVGPFILNNYQKWPIVAGILVYLPVMIDYMVRHTPTLLKFIFWSIVYKLMDHAASTVDDPRKVARLAGGVIGKLGMAGFESTIRTLGYALGVVKDILLFVIAQSGQLAAREASDRVRVIKEVAARVGNTIDDPTASKILGEIVTSSVQLTPLVTKLHGEIARLGL